MHPCDRWAASSGAGVDKQIYRSVVLFNHVNAVCMGQLRPELLDILLKFLHELYLGVRVQSLGVASVRLMKNLAEGPHWAM